MKSQSVTKKIKLTLIIAVAFLMVFSTSYFVLRDVAAQAQDVCPSTGDWVKIDGINAQTFEYTAPEGKQIVETCYKAGTILVFKDVVPPLTEITLESNVLNPEENAFQDISHASFRLEDITSTPTPTPTFTFTPTPTFTVTPTPTEVTELVPLTISGLCSEAVVSLVMPQGDDVTITWQVTNANDIDISFNWTANNGQNGSGTAPANSNTSFITDISGSSVTLGYTLNEESKEELASIEPCQPQQETEEPTPQPTDSQPDQPAGGSGPSITGMLLPFIAGISGIGVLATILTVAKKKIKI